MTIDVTTLDRRSPSSLRAFVRAQHLGVKRRPDAVDSETTSDDDYWRYLVRRAPLEGTCVKYQTYDAGGDENDWNINIDPDPAYRWMLDPNVLYALSQTSGAPSPINLNKIKVVQGVLVIECELTPDDGLYDTFTDAGLPISEGSWIPNQEGNEFLGPTGSWVGVYGVFAGDFGHDGRPEIHPFDAFWRKFHQPRSSSISWDLGVFQDDSNRFNDDWSRAPIDVEFRVPFCVDIPVTRRTPVARSLSFTLERSQFCSVVGKNLRSNGTPDLSEVFLAPTVTFNRRLRNSLEVSVRDLTGLPGRPFALSFADLRYTTAGRFGPLLGQAWLSGQIVMRVAVNQDGFAYWNFAGPNSRTAADAPNSNGTVVDPGDVTTTLATERERRPRHPPLRFTEARPVVATEGGSSLTAELVIERSPRGAEPVSQTIMIRPREHPLFVDEESGDAFELESFDLSTKASITSTPDAPRRIESDISTTISHLAGLPRSKQLPPTIATIDVDDVITVDFRARYAPFRNGEVYGEERSLLSESVNRAATGPTEVQINLNTIGSDGTMLRGRFTRSSRNTVAGLPEVRIEDQEFGHRLVIGPLGVEPIALELDATLTDAFGLRSTTRATVQNFRVFDARVWIEQTVQLSLAQLTQRRDELERAAQLDPNDAAVADASMIRALVDVLESFDHRNSVSAAQLAGAVRLARRVQALLSPGVATRLFPGPPTRRR